MLKRITTLFALLCAMSLLTGCAVNRATASLTPGADLSKMKTAYVVKFDKDVHKVNEIIAKKLESKGYSVTTGPEMTPPYKADVAVTYTDRWMWDLTMYMIELTVNFRDPKTSFPIATGNSLHTSLTRKSPEEMADEVLSNILAAPKQ